jgi:aryl-alcohol dehydrogenase-like predicted oxidoreductase
MAQELGLGVMPWSPLAGGRISGKYTRENAGSTQYSRDARTWGGLTEKHYQIVDALARIAGELDTTVARVALAWVQGRPGVASTIIGARTLAQLEDNIQALEVRLTAAHVAALDDLTAPELPFPIPFLSMARSFHSGGTTINGVPSVLLPISPKNRDDRY